MLFIPSWIMTPKLFLLFPHPLTRRLGSYDNHSRSYRTLALPGFGFGTPDWPISAMLSSRREVRSVFCELELCLVDVRSHFVVDHRKQYALHHTFFCQIPLPVSNMSHIQRKSVHPVPPQPDSRTCVFISLVVAYQSKKKHSQY